jgi:putative heme-binding domain-containing protein
MEPVLTGGMDNPVGVAFTAGGERILCGTFFITHEPGKRDGLIHAIYGGVYGKVNDATDGHKRTGDLMPIMTHMGPAAPCSVIRYEASSFGREYADNLFVCSFNLHKVSRHILQPDGATFKTRDIDFVTSDNSDFHPTDVIEDADGSLLVIDTGGWYKICCPTSQLSKPDVLGAIYRVRRSGAPRVRDPRGMKLAWDKMQAKELSKLLNDERPAVRERAMARLGRQGAGAVGAISAIGKSSDPLARRNAVWALTRIDAPAARAAVRVALNDTDETVRQVALHSVSLWRDTDATKQLMTIVQAPAPQLQRVAAEALGRIGDKNTVARLVIRSGSIPEAFNREPDKAAIRTLLGVAEQKHDRVLEHSITYALEEIDNPVETATGLKSSSPSARRTALIALDQMDHRNLRADTVAPLLGSPDATVRETAAWIASLHADWGGELAGYFEGRLTGGDLSENDCRELERQLAHFGHAREIQALMGSVLGAAGTPTAVRRLLLQAMVGAAPKPVPPAWIPAVESALKAPDEVLLRPAVAAAKVLVQGKTNATTFNEILMTIAGNESYSADLRLEALAAQPGQIRAVDPKIFAFVCANLDGAKPVSTRATAASVLAKARLSEEQLLSLGELMASAGPLEVSKLLAAFDHTNSEPVGLKLMSSLKGSKALSSVRVDALKTLLAKYPASVQERGAELLALINVDSAKQTAHLEELLVALKEGDVRRGQGVFNGQKAACFACHKMGYMGGQVGPDLTSIGQVRTERDLLESIVYPSASFVRSYEPVIVHTKNDEDFSGVLKKDAADEIILATGPNVEARIARSDVTEIRPGTVSVMPAGLDEQLSKQELADLLAFLKATKWGPR